MSTPYDDILTLRDRFAMAALTGMLAYSHVHEESGNYHVNCRTDVCCEIAYDYADAMLKARDIQEVKHE